MIHSINTLPTAQIHDANADFTQVLGGQNQTPTWVEDYADDIVMHYAKMFDVDEVTLKAHLLDVAEKFKTTDSYQKFHQEFYYSPADQDAALMQSITHPDVMETGNQYQLYALMELAASAHVGHRPAIAYQRYDGLAFSAETKIEENTRVLMTDLVEKVCDDKILWLVGGQSDGAHSAMTYSFIGEDIRPAIELYSHDYRGNALLGAADHANDLVMIVHEGQHAIDLLSGLDTKQDTFEEDAFLFEYRGYVTSARFETASDDPGEIARYVYAKLAEVGHNHAGGMYTYPFNRPGTEDLTYLADEYGFHTMTADEITNFEARRDFIFCILEQGGLLTYGEVAEILDPNTTGKQADKIATRVYNRHN